MHKTGMGPDDMRRGHEDMCICGVLVFLILKGKGEGGVQVKTLVLKLET
jgi:hypothetical protein